MGVQHQGRSTQLPIDEPAPMGVLALAACGSRRTERHGRKITPLKSSKGRTSAGEEVCSFFHSQNKDEPTAKPSTQILPSAPSHHVLLDSCFFLIWRYLLKHVVPSQVVLCLCMSLSRLRPTWDPHGCKLVSKSSQVFELTKVWIKQSLNLVASQIWSGAPRQAKLAQAQQGAPSLHEKASNSSAFWPWHGSAQAASAAIWFKNKFHFHRWRACNGTTLGWKPYHHVSHRSPCEGNT